MSSCALLSDSVRALGWDEVLDPGVRADVLRHLDGCLACRSLLADQRELAAAAAQEAPGEHEVNVARLWQSISAGCARVERSRHGSCFWSFDETFKDSAEGFAAPVVAPSALV